MKAIVTVLGRDGTGIIAGVSTLLAQESINILNVSQTILDGNFTMMMTVDMSNAKNDLETVKVKADKLSEQLKVQIAIQNQAIFDRMHQL
ncbi:MULTISPECIES: ACT domain-containing protein [Brochothrix]|uniref:UPF0237 protein BTBSAS_10169 n=1 Tax=Brochothrix thermosphacta TaxID=2756 RepID=A0A1D2LM79_BROTH|nr:MULTISPECIES: ACT domain-containing protein [Brochothrix]SLM90176.1 ACT domain protein [Brachybacterium faecium]ANZ94670.1 hypothetical protein BFC19_04285 [Brochothrix thermosphacta]ANZ97018.1 hypothetical protein BFC20_04435 [Brochothrix thermosphacta]ATF26445.1 ACT domain-containing protein [Brochothrix thermosphacta]ATH85797.1 ACT domain-containing protein [Brochothrix thermosphacta]